MAADAGSYSVTVCDGSGANHAFQAYGDGAFVVPEAGCRPQFTGTGYQSGGIRVRNSVNAPGQDILAPLFTSGGLRAQAPPGTVITRLRGSATAYDDMGSTFVDGWRAGISDDVTGLWCGFHSACSWSGPPMLGIDLAATPGATRIDLGVTCALWTGCKRDRLRAVVNLDAATIDIDDQAAPWVASTGNGWSSGWSSSAITAAVRAGDGAGVRRTWFTIDGGVAQSETTFPCDPYAMAPCPADTGTTTAALSIAALADGQHTLTLHAQDAGMNEGTAALPLAVDNNAPVVSAVQTVTPPAWQRVNRFELRVTAGDVAGGSGVQRLDWELCHEDGSACALGWTTDVASRLWLTAPGPGSWKARFWASDALRSGVKSDWSGPLRFDPTVPGVAAIGGAEGWTRAATPSVALAMAAGAARGPSGIAGYAAATGDTAPGTAIVVDGGEASLALGELPEGVTNVNVRAISGAGVPASQVATAQVRVDRSAPLLGVTRDPDGADTEWLGRETSIAVHVQDALSGMDAAPADSPEIAGGRITYAIDGGEPTTVRGPDATIAIAETGDHAVALHAYDAAGNVSRERLLRVRVDRTAPSGDLLAFDPERPRRLRAAIEDLCIRSATLELRRRDDVDWHVQAATVDASRVWADIADDRLPAGAYDARFRVTDCAGNVGIVEHFATQAAASDGTVLRLPLRAQPGLQVAFDGDDLDTGSGRLTLRMGHPAHIWGGLADSEGAGLVGQPVLVQQRIGVGDWRTLMTRITDTLGLIEATIPSGPSRRLRLVAEPDELTVGAVSRILRIAVPARATIRMDHSRVRNGSAVRFSGHVLGGYMPAGGRELELQGFNPLRGRWQPVRTSGLRSDGHGAWHASYRFTVTRGTVRYRFRLRIPPRPDHPFANGYSRAVTVVVTG